MARPDHDLLYRRLFSDPRLVAQLIRDFVSGPWLDDLDLDGLEPVNTKFHTDTGERREADMIWRVPRRAGGNTYLLLLMEFQSTADPWMAVRVLVYVGLLWQFLVKTKQLPPGGKLPPVLPVVIYNGEPRWYTPEAVRDLVDLPADSPLWLWQPAMRYHLIDEGTFGAKDLAERDGLPALLFRLEGSPDPSEVVAVADRVLEWLGRHPGFPEARSVFAELLGALVRPLEPHVRVPEDLQELRNMLATRAERWIQGWRLEGRQEGEATLLLRLLERRFGPLPENIRDRVLAADMATLEEWGDRVLDAGSLADVLKSS